MLPVSGAEQLNTYKIQNNMKKYNTDLKNERKKKHLKINITMIKYVKTV